MDVFDEICGVIGSPGALAELCNVSEQAVSKWKRGRIPAERVRLIERETGIPAERIRPDVFGPAPVNGQRVDGAATEAA